MTREEFIEEMIINFDELTSSDLQGIVEARCIKTGENADELLNEIYQTQAGIKE